MSRSGWIDSGLGAAIALFGLWRITGVLYYDATIPVLIALLMGVAGGLYRRAPAVALGLVWLTGLLQVVRGLDIALVQLAAVLVAFGTARYGRRLTVWLSAVSIPLGAVAALLYATFQGTAVIQESGLWQLLNLITSATDLGFDAGTMLLAGFVLATALLAGPWALGLVFRLREQSRVATEARERAQEDATRAKELAALRDGQAKLARDVHDVVGHSLAVIVAQADSVQSLPDADIARIRAAMANIAESARSSLADVREVLADDEGGSTSRSAADLDSLIDGVRAAGTTVGVVTEGTARPLAPDRALVAYRSLQEMLTNALKHGAGGPIAVTLQWGADELVIRVSNDAELPGAIEEGSGIRGLRERLDAVGGRLEIDADTGTFSTTAVLPLRSEVAP